LARKHYRLPPLSALATFECAARKLSFKDAARELNVTPGAVSHQIKLLEHELATSLFIRKPRGVTLTADGQALFVTLGDAFRDISKSLNSIRRSDDEPSVTIGATTAVSSLQLTHAIGRFWREHGNILINQNVTDRPFSSHDRPDLYVRYGRDPDPLVVQKPLFRDVLVPVCSPAMAIRLHGADLPVLAGSRLIHLDAEDQHWTTWKSWFQELGHDGTIARGVIVTNYMIALHIAIDGGGIALGWSRLIEPMLRSGALVRLSPWQLDAPADFFVVSRPDAYLSAAALTLRDWLGRHLLRHE